MKDKKITISGLKKHVRQCSICAHPLRKDIEMDYIHCIPWSDLKRRYNIGDNHIIERHAIMTELYKKRDRKALYWKIIERFDYNKISAENVIEAAKQLDRLEHKIDVNTTPSNIQIVYNWDALSGKSGHKDRLQSATDATQIPPLPGEVSPL